MLVKAPGANLCSCVNKLKDLSILTLNRPARVTVRQDRATGLGVRTVLAAGTPKTGLALRDIIIVKYSS